MMLSNLALFAQNAATPEQVGFIIGFIIAFLAMFVIGTAIYFVLGGVLLRFVTKMVCGVRLRFGTAVWFTFLVWAINLGAGIVIFLLCLLLFGNKLQVPGSAASVIRQVLWMLANFYLGGLFYGTFIKDYYDRPIGFGKGLMISLVLLVIVIAVFAAFGLLAYVLLLSSGANFGG